MRYLLAIFIIFCSAVCAIAQTSTEIYGFYQDYRNFSFQIGGGSVFDVPEIKMSGGGFGFVQNLAPWFAIWNQFAFYGAVEQLFRIQVLNELQGIRFQTQQYGPLQLYAKGGVGFSRYGIESLGSSYHVSFSYGGGAQIWLNDWLGAVLDGSHVIMGLPNLTDLPDREKWDSGLAFTAGLAVRF